MAWKRASTGPGSMQRQITSFEPHARPPNSFRKPRQGDLILFSQISSIRNEGRHEGTHPSAVLHKPSIYSAMYIFFFRSINNSRLSGLLFPFSSFLSGRGTTDKAANLLQATHQKRALVHPRVFDRLAAPVEDTWALREPRLHPVRDRLVLQARDRAKPAVGALRTDFAIVACQLVSVVNLLQPAQMRR